MAADPFVASGSCRLKGMRWSERDQVRTIAARARTINDGGSRPEYARLYADILHLLHMIGGEFAERQEQPGT